MKKILYFTPLLSLTLIPLLSSCNSLIAPTLELNVKATNTVNVNVFQLDNEQFGPLTRKVVALEAAFAEKKWSFFIDNQTPRSLWSKYSEVNGNKKHEGAFLFFVDIDYRDPKYFSTYSDLMQFIKNEDGIYVVRPWVNNISTAFDGVYDKAFSFGFNPDVFGDYTFDEQVENLEDRVFRAVTFTWSVTLAQNGNIINENHFNYNMDNHHKFIFDFYSYEQN